MKNVLSGIEYRALDYHMEKAKLYDSGLYIKQEPNRGDYFVDDENDCEYSLKEGLEIILDTITEDAYNEYPNVVQCGLYNLFFNRLGIILKF